MVSAFDTATAFALNFGIAKFQLAQEKVKLVGEIVGREGRSPNPAIVRAIEKWPPVNTLKDLQAFLGTASYVRAHAGPAYNRVASPLRELLRPTARFPPNEAQLKAIEEIKKLVLEDHVLAVPDEFAAITAANRWLQDEAPGGRTYEMAADTSGRNHWPMCEEWREIEGVGVLLSASECMPAAIPPVRAGVLGPSLYPQGHDQASWQDSGYHPHGPCEHCES